MKEQVRESLEKKKLEAKIPANKKKSVIS